MTNKTSNTHIMSEKEIISSLQDTLEEVQNQNFNLVHKNMKLQNQRDQLLEALNDALEWIDAVPQDTKLPALPDFVRNDINKLIADVKGEQNDN